MTPETPAWRFWVPMALQLLIVASVPAPMVWAHQTGTTVLLRTAPVDPYDMLRGRYMRLGYADAGGEPLTKLPGATEALAKNDVPAWVEFQPTQPDRPWQAVRVHAARPADLPAGHVAIKGRVSGSSVDWGMDAYFIPEAAGDALEDAMRKDNGKATWVEARVAANGTAVLEGLWVAGKRY